MSSLRFNFDDHRNKCRCCLRDFDEDDDVQIKLTKMVQNRFLELTQLKVRNFLQLEIRLRLFFFQLEVSDSYSSVTCEQCCNKLREFSVWRKELVEKQLCLHEFEADLKRTAGRRDSIIQHASERDVPPLMDQEDDSHDVELKIEAEEYVFNDGTAINDKSSKSTPAQVKELCDPLTSKMNRSAQVSNKVEAEMLQHELVEDHPVQKTKELEPLKRGRPRKPKGKKCVCKICGKSLASSQALKFHQDAIHFKIVRFECDFCGRKIYQKHLLRKHLKRHVEGKPLKAECRGYYDRTRPFPCNIEGCDRFYKTSLALAHHSLFHSGKLHRNVHRS